ncbi:MAG: S8 family serine peptidase, partial [Candidatus Magasanikbacteria bacterium]|nr:S8 family serine peptidase [Candidatus Magasanikbacteria bacterium]
DGNGYADDLIGYDFVHVDDLLYAYYVSLGYTFISQEDFTSLDYDPSDYNGHGTHVAGIAAAEGNNGKGVIGVCPYCRIMPIRAGFSIKKGDKVYGTLTSGGIFNGINYAVRSGAKIISMSFGGYYSAEGKQALDNAYAAGVFLVAAAGNSNTDNTTASFPGADTNVFSVAAIDSNSNRASFSNFGSWVEISSPGVNILSTVPKIGAISDISGYKAINGTSMATPYVSGAAGLILVSHPSWNISQLWQALLSGADPINNPDKYIGRGKINLFKSLSITSLPSSLPTAKINLADYGNFAQTDLTVNGQASKGYTLEIGRGYYPTAWSQINSSSGGVNGVLGTLRIDSLENDYYTLRLTVTNGSIQNQDQKIIYVNKGWPKILTQLQGDQSFRYINPLNLNQDSKNELLLNLLIDTKANDSDGNVLSGWPVFNTVPLASVDFNKDGKDEILALKRTCETCRYLQELHLLNANGQTISKINGSFPTESNVDERTAAIGHFNSVDGQNLILLNKVWNDQKAGWDCKFSSYNIPDLSGGFSTILPGLCRVVSLGDLNNDGLDEAILATDDYPTSDNSHNNHLYIINKNGVQKTIDDTGMIFTLMLADVNKDGFLEIIIDASGKGLYIRNKDGGLLAGNWPQLTNTYNVGGSYINASIAIGDVTGDGMLDIVAFRDLIIGDKNIHVFKYDGTDQWSYALSHKPSWNGGPIIADFNNDGQAEIILTSEIPATSTNLTKFPYIHILKYLVGDIKEPVALPPLKWTQTVRYPIVGDFNGDGLVEIYVTTTDLNTRWVILNRIVGGQYNKDLSFWPMERHDPQHTGTYPSKIILPKSVTYTLPVANYSMVSGATMSVSWTTTGYTDNTTNYPIYLLYLDNTPAPYKSDGTNFSSMPLGPAYSPWTYNIVLPVPAGQYKWVICDNWTGFTQPTSSGCPVGSVGRYESPIFTVTAAGPFTKTLEVESAPTKNGGTQVAIYGEQAISFTTYGFVQFPASSLGLQTGKNYYIWMRQARPSASARGIYLYNGSQALISDKKTSPLLEVWYWTKYNKINQPTNFIFTSADLSNGIVIKGDGQTGIVYADKLLITDNPNYNPNGAGQQKFYYEAENANVLNGAIVENNSTASGGKRISYDTNQYFYGFSQLNWFWDTDRTYSIWTRQFRPAGSNRGIYLYNPSSLIQNSWKQTGQTGRWEWVYHGGYTQSQFGSAIVAKGDGKGGILYLDRILIADPGYNPNNIFAPLFTFVDWGGGSYSANPTPQMSHRVWLSFSNGPGKIISTQTLLGYNSCFSIKITTGSEPTCNENVVYPQGSKCRYYLQLNNWNGTARCVLKLSYEELGVIKYRYFESYGQINNEYIKEIADPTGVLP